MSGHSHAKTVKRVKDANAAAKGKIFSKLGKLITIAAKDGGGLEFNSRLKQVVDEAKQANMPKDNIEKAIKRGTGELADGYVLEEICYEALGPGGAVVIIEGITDNKNRTLGEIKQILNKYNGKLASEGSAKWKFEKRGIITINTGTKANQEELELKAIEAGADDLSWYQEEDWYMEVRCLPENLESVKQALKNQGFNIDSASLGWVAKDEIALTENETTSCQKMFEELDENDSVQNIYANLKI